MNPVEPQTPGISARQFKPRRQQRRRKALLLAMLFLPVLALLLFITFRGGRTYRGDLARLLPPHTAGFLVFQDMAGLHEELARTDTASWMIAQEALSRAMLSDEDLAEMRESGLPLDRPQAEALMGRFFRRWFGRNLVLGFFASDDSDAPALVALAQTRAGFGENLAELLGALWPGVQRQSIDYHGVPLTLFRGDDPGESIAYCRFGKTVAISLFHDSYEPLRAVVDRRFDPELPSLVDDPGFRRFQARCLGGEGLAAFVHPAETIDLIETHARINLDKHPGSRANLQFARDLLAPIPAISGRIFLRREPHALVAQFFPQSAAISPGTDPEIPLPPPRIAQAFPGESLLFAHGRSQYLGQIVRRFTFGFPDEAEIRQESEEWNGRLVRDFGVDLEKDLLPLIEGEMGFGWIDAAPGLIFPAVHAAAIVRVNDPGKMDSLLARAYGVYADRVARGRSVEWDGIARLPGGAAFSAYTIPMDLPGGLGVRVSGDFLLLAFPASSLEAIAARLTGEPAGTDMAAQIAQAGGPSLYLAASPQRIARRVESCLKPLAAWDADVREDLEEAAPWLAFMQSIPQVRLVRARGEQGDEIELVLPLH